MNRLSGLDATFLYSETPTVFMHTLKIALLRVPEEDGKTIFERFREVMATLLDRLPAFRQRALGVPFGFHHPSWVEDPDFDLDNHVEHIVLEAPGSRVQMDNAIAQIASQPLERSQPLWTIAVIEGLEDGRVAFVAKIHHAVADGIASAASLSAVMTSDPNAGVAEPPQRRTRKLPSRLRMAWDALIDQPRRAGNLVPLVVRTLMASRNVFADDPRKEGFTRPFDAPKTVFNGALSTGRSFASTSLNLSEIRRIKSALGVSVNDVILSVAGQAVRSYLAARGEEPKQSLVATVPVSSTAAGLRYVRGNRLSNMFTSLCSDEPDPATRVRAIHEAAKASKAAHGAMGSKVMAQWAEYTPAIPYQLGFKLYSKLRIAELHRPAANMVVSNVRGPAQKLFVAGAELTELISVGPILPGIGLNMTAWSYDDRVGVAVLADGVAVPDAHLIIERLQPALDELTGCLGPKRTKKRGSRAVS